LQLDPLWDSGWGKHTAKEGSRGINTTFISQWLTCG
jgi:hypothetical protein